MKTLVFSDSHLSLPFDEKKYRFLQSIISDADHVIVNGDLWEGFFMTFSQFVESPYRHLFPLLKKKRTIYIHGNHDDDIFCDERVYRFCDVSTDTHTMQVNGSRLVFKHGDEFAPILENNRSSPLPPTTQKISRLIQISEQAIVRKLGRKAMSQTHGRFNKMIKKRMKKTLAATDILVCGHTHFSEFSPEKQFINTGLVKYGLGQYMLIEGDRLIPKETWYA